MGSKTYEVTSPDGKTFEVTAPDTATQDQVLAYAQQQFSQMPKQAEPSRNAGVAGIANFGASLAGLPVDTVANALNLGIAVAGVATGTTPDTIKAPVGGSEWIKEKLRSSGVGVLNPDNPNPGSKTDTAAYDLASRGGFVPGGFMPAVGSIIAEKIGGPQWAGVGAMVPAAAGAAGRAVIDSVKPSPQAKILMDEGVTLTPGQRAGGAIKRAEDAATSVPILGDAVKGAQRRSIEDFGIAGVNRALAPIGDKVPSGMKGNAAVEYARNKLGDAYESLLPNLKGDMNARGPANALPSQPGQAAPLSFADELSNIKQIGQSLPAPQRGQLDRIIKNEVVSRFTPSGLASGETLKDIESKLGFIERGFRKSDNYDIRTLGQAIQEVQNAMRRMVETVNPAYRGELAKINEGYANFKIAQRAASSIGSNEGVYTPAQYNSAVRAKDPSKDKARFAEGNALNQDLAQAGKAVLPSVVPDSGTPYRAMLAYALAHPVKATALGIPLAAAAAGYTPLGQSALQAILNKQPGADSALQQTTLQAILANQRQ